MDWLFGRSNKEKRSAVMNVLTVMAADGEVGRSEMEHLARVANRVGLSRSELEDILNHPERVEFVVPKDQDERIAQLMDAIFMMLVDGEIDKREMAACAILASKLGFKSEVVPEIIAALVEAAKRGRDREQAKIRLKDLLR